jgi:HK97 family phage portal protein
MSFIASLFERRSIENPSVPLSDIDADSGLWDTLTGGGASSSGVRVNRKSAMGYAAYWRGLNLISRDFAKLPLYVYRKMSGGGKERALDHPAYAILRRSPNSVQKVFDFKQALMANALEGNGYAYIYRNGSGMPLELLWLSPDRTWPIRENGVLWYVTQLDSGEQRRIAPEDILHHHGLGFDGTQGYSVLDVAKETLGLGLAAAKYGSIFFKNGATPNVVLEHPGKMGKPAVDRLRSDWEKLYAGLDQAHRTAILEDGLKAHVLSIDARKAQLLEIREFEVRQVANLLGIPPEMLGISAGVVYKQYETMRQSYLDNGLDPWLVQFEEECERKLLTRDEQESESHSIEFQRSALVRADFVARQTGYKLGIEGGYLSPDEAREGEGLNPIPDGLGKTFYVPRGMVVAGEEPAPEDAPEGAPEAPPEDEPDPEEEEKQRMLHSAARDCLDDARRRMAKRIGLHATKAAKTPDVFVYWCDERLERDHREVWLAAMGPAVRMAAACGVLPAGTTLDEESRKFFDLSREALLTAAECKPSELPLRVEAWAAEIAG